jgi:hypothetical protein
MGMVADNQSNTFRCPFPEEGWRQLYATFGMGDAPPYELGYGETMSFPNVFPATALQALCRGDIGSSLGGGVGEVGQSVFTCDLPAKDIADGLDLTNPMNTHPIAFKITVKVEVTPACPELIPPGFTPLIALYTLHLPTDDGIPANQNPVVSGIFVTDSIVAVVDAGTSSPDPGAGGIDGGVDPIDGGVSPMDGSTAPADEAHGGPEGAVRLDEEPVVTIRRNQHVGLALDIDIATAERLAVPGTIDYEAVTQTRSVALTRHYEHLSFSWYLESGDFTDGGRGHDTGYLPTAIPDTQPEEGPSAEDRANFDYNTSNSWDTPKSEDWGHQAARIVVVVRDGRGGVAWTSKQVGLEGQP